MNDTQEEAHRLLESGLPITLCPQGSKKPLGDGWNATHAGKAWQKKSWTGREIDKAFNAEAVKPFHVQRWLDGNAKIKSPATANHRITIIAAVFSWAAKMGYISDNPLEKMPKPRRRIWQEFFAGGPMAASFEAGDG
jgi:hypothetical protein